MSDLNELSRRSLLKRTAGMMALAIGGGTPFLSSRAAWAQSADLAKQSLRTIGLSVTVLHQNSRNAKARRQFSHQLAERVQTTPRRADDHDRV